jgi:hypothetical protein
MHAQIHIQCMLTYIHETRRMNKYYTFICTHVCLLKKLWNLIECLVEFLIFFTHKKVASPQMFDFSSKCCICMPCDFFAVTLIQSESNTGSNMAKTWSQKMKKARLNIFYIHYSKILSSESHGNTPTSQKLSSSSFLKKNRNAVGKKLYERFCT